jgi:hypothetical protein
VITMISAKLNMRQVAEDISALEILLSDHENLGESGPGSLQELFSLRPSLLMLMPRAFFSTMAPACYLPECSILHEFRADYAIANKDHSKCLFVEFEHA